MNNTYNDNIIPTPLFDPPYRLILVQYVKWDKKQFNLFHIVDDPVVAYGLYKDFKKSQPENQKHLFEYAIWDSWHHEATEYCKSIYDKLVNEGNKNLTF